jgi:3-phenylpropionate/cinnamic acid dioxygenase small subunit
MQDLAVQQLLDRAAIHDLLLRYARAVDGKNLDQVAACFVRDASYEGALGRGTINDAIKNLKLAFERYHNTMHFIGNVLVDFDDGTHARAETYAIAYHRLKAGDGGQQYVTAVRYLDQLARHDAQWRITHRLVRREWDRHDAIVPLRAPETAHA